MSIGVERVFTILEARAKKLQAAVKSNPVDVFVAAAGGDLLEERMRITSSLWKNGIKAEFSAKRKVKPLDQFSYAEKNFIPLIVIIGPEELKSGFVKLRCTSDRSEENVQLESLTDVIQSKLNTIKMSMSMESLQIN